MMKIFGRIITTVSGQTIRDVMRYSRIKVGPDMMEFLSRKKCSPVWIILLLTPVPI